MNETDRLGKSKYECPNYMEVQLAVRFLPIGENSWSK